MFTVAEQVRRMISDLQIASSFSPPKRPTLQGFINTSTDTSKISERSITEF